MSIWPQFSITSGQGWLGPKLWPIKWVKKVSCGGVFDLAVEQPQLFRKLHKNKTNIGNLKIIRLNYTAIETWSFISLMVYLKIKLNSWTLLHVHLIFHSSYDVVPIWCFIFLIQMCYEKIIFHQKQYLIEIISSIKHDKLLCM